MNRLLYIILVPFVFVEEVRTGFRYGWSYYHIVDNKTDLTSWSEKKEKCESSSGYLASLTTADEVNAVSNQLKSNSYPGNYRITIGLSRLPDLDKNVDANWKWETGEPFNSTYFSWKPGNPNGPRNKLVGVRIDKETDQLSDVDAEKLVRNSYICERDMKAMYRSFAFGVKINVTYLKCALQCLRQRKCIGFDLNDVGCRYNKQNGKEPHFRRIIH